MAPSEAVEHDSLRGIHSHVSRQLSGSHYSSRCLTGRPNENQTKDCNQRRTFFRLAIRNRVFVLQRIRTVCCACATIEISRGEISARFAIPTPIIRFDPFGLAVVVMDGRMVSPLGALLLRNDIVPPREPVSLNAPVPAEPTNQEKPL